eukprot:1353697-Pyramimonas_sp.AAC.1
MAVVAHAGSSFHVGEHIDQRPGIILWVGGYGVDILAAAAGGVVYGSTLPARWRSTLLRDKQCQFAHAVCVATVRGPVSRARLPPLMYPAAAPSSSILLLGHTAASFQSKSIALLGRSWPRYWA